MSKKYLDTVGLNKLVANILSKFASKNHSHSNATTNSAGFMSSSDKVKLDGVSTGANRTIVDSTLSSTSVNAIQNKAVKAALDGKAASSHAHPTAQITGLDAALSGKAPSSHNHSASNITSGTLPVGRGGTGASSSKGAQYNIMNDILEGTVNASDSDVFILKHHTPSATNGALLTRSAAQVWAWIKSKTDQLYATRTHNHDSAYAAKTHNHDAANITSGTLSISRGGTGATSVSGVRNIIGVNPITTTGSGSAYVASVPHISTLVAGATFTMVPHVVSTATSPTLNVNGLGAKAIRQRLSNSTLSTAPGATANWLAAGKPVEMMYDGQFWVVDFVRPNMASAYGVLPVVNGGTGASNAADACKNLNAVKYGADKMTEGILQMDDIGYSVKWIAHDGREARISANDHYLKYTRKDSNGTYLDKFVNWNSFYSEQAEKASVMLVRTLANTLSDAQAAEVLLLFDDWRVNVQYKQDDLCRYNDKLYRCNNEHTSSGQFTPEVASLWTEIDIAPDGVMIWHAPSGSHDAPKYGDKVHYPGAEGPIYTSLMDGNTTIPSSDDRYWAIEQSNEEQDKAILEWKPVQPGVNEAYKKGDKVTHKGKTWISDIDNNVWEPSVYGWTEDGGAKPEPEPQPEPSGYPAWKQPTGGHDAYKKGDKVSHKGKNWQSTIDANVWEPGAYGWVEVS